MSLHGQLPLREERKSHRMEEAMGGRMTTESTMLRGRAMAVVRATGVRQGSIQEIETEVTKVAAVVGAIVTKALGSTGKEEITVECETIRRGVQPGMVMETPAKIRIRGSHKVEDIEIGALTSVIDNKIWDTSSKIKLMIDLASTIMKDDTRGMNTMQGREITLLILLGLALSPLKDEEVRLQITKMLKSKSMPIFRMFQD